METIIKYTKLPFTFDVAAMQQEANALSEAWRAHYNTNDYTGDWKAIPLRSINGDTSNAYAVQSDNAVFKNTELLQQSPVIKSVVDSFNCEKTSVRLLNLTPGAVVKEHKDPGLCFEEGEIRLHIPISTNNKVEFYIEDEAIFPQQGECWYMNFNLKHRLANNGNTERIHLIIDCIVNDWVRNIFANCNEADVHRVPAPEALSHKEQLMMIEQLKNMGTDTALSIANNMEVELNKKQNNI